MKKHVFVLMVVLVALAGCKQVQRLQDKNIQEELLEQLQNNISDEYGIRFYSSSGGGGRSQIVKELRYQIKSEEITTFNAQTISEIWHDKDPEVYCYQKDNLLNREYSCECVYLYMEEGSRRETKPCAGDEKIDYTKSLTLTRIKNIVADNAQGWSNITKEVNGTIVCYANKVYIPEQMHYTEKKQICFDQGGFRSFSKSESSGPYGSSEEWERIPVPIELIEPVPYIWQK